MRPLIRNAAIHKPTVKTPWCSVIIPVLNEASILKQQIRTLSDTLPATGIEIILVDGGSDDDTFRIAGALGCRVITSARGRARQMNTGAAHARGSYLYFLHLDTTPPAEWTNILFSAIQEETHPLTFRLRFSGQAASRLLRFYSWCSQFDVDAFRYGDQSLLVRREDFLAVGGFREDHRLMEGHDLIRRLRRRTGRLTIHPAAVTTSSRRYVEYGVIFTQTIFTLIYLLYRVGVPQRQLAAIHNWAFRQ